MTRAITIVAGLLSACAAAENVKVNFPGGNEFEIVKNEVVQIDESAQRGHPIDRLVLQGPRGVGNVFLVGPRLAPSMRHVNPILAACKDANYRTDKTLGKVATDERFYRDYVGSELLKKNWKYWIYFEGDFCTTGDDFTFDPARDVYFICGGKNDEFRCIREHSREDYAAYYFIDQSQFPRWKSIAASVDQYLANSIHAAHSH